MPPVGREETNLPESYGDCGSNGNSGIKFSLVSDAQVEDMHKLQLTSKLPIAAIACFHCGKSNHLAQQCRLKAVKCHGRRKIGHLVKVCCSTALKKRQTWVLKKSNISKWEHQKEKKKYYTRRRNICVG